MIYLDTSVVLAELFAEDRRPPRALWQRPLLSSRLLEYEAWTRVHALARAGTHSGQLLDLLARVAFAEMTPFLLARALEPFPLPLRALDALHLATASYLRDRGVAAELASYDARMLEAAAAMNIPAATL